jgi:hypothetical protein
LIILKLCFQKFNFIFKFFHFFIVSFPLPQLHVFNFEFINFLSFGKITLSLSKKLTFVIKVRKLKRIYNKTNKKKQIINQSNDIKSNNNYNSNSRTNDIGFELHDIYHGEKI